MGLGRERKARWNRTDHTCERCDLYIKNKLVESLEGIWDIDDDYRREIAAGLAEEHLPLTPLGSRH